MLVQITKQKSYIIEKENSRFLILHLNNIQPTEIKDYYIIEGQTFYTNKILKLKLHEKHTISLGDTIIVDKTKFTITEIIPSNNYGYYLLDGELNKSAKFILPLVTDSLIATNLLFKTCLYNTFLYCNKYPEYSDNKHLFISYKFTDHTVYKEMETLLINNKNFIKVLDPDTTFTVFIFEIPKKYWYVVNDILAGKYHYFDGYIKDIILNFFSPITNANIKYKTLFNNIRSVLNRDDYEVKKLEKSLDISLPYHIGIESIPLVQSETLIL